MMYVHAQIFLNHFKDMSNTVWASIATYTCCPVEAGLALALDCHCHWPSDLFAATVDLACEQIERLGVWCS